MLLRLYRIQVFQPQTSLLESFPGGKQVLKEILASPRIERRLRTRRYFLVGRKSIDEHSTWFKFARTRKVNTIDFDGDDFYEVEHPDHPFVHIFVDSEIEFVAIERNSRFSPSLDNSALSLKKLLENTDACQRFGAEVHINPIRDPNEFIDYLRKAWQITKFYFDVRRPNVLDAADFIAPLKRLNQEGRAQKSRTIMDGASIDNMVAEELTRSCASTGDDAGAYLRMPGDKKFVQKSLGKNFIHILWDENLKDSTMNLISKLRDTYEKVRDHNDR